MKKFIFITLLLKCILSCEPTESKLKELELKERELDLKEKENGLKENQVKTDSFVNQLQNTIQKSSSSIAGTYIVTATKSYFFDSPDFKTIRKGFVLKGDEVEVKEVKNDFAYSIYTSSTGKQIKGWLLYNELIKSTNSEFNPKVDYEKFVGRWKTSSDNKIEVYNIDYKKGQFFISVDWSKEWEEEMENGNHMNILFNCANYIGKLNNGILRAKHTLDSSCDDELEIGIKSDNQIVVTTQHDKTKVVYTRQ